VVDPLGVLLVAAVTLGVVHTVLGPDHYLPFVAMAQARGWSVARTAGVTGLCGLGHVLSSVALGAAGIALGITVARLEAFEATRGDLAAWALTAFGVVYTAWGVRRALRGVPHTHRHAHANGSRHEHEHGHAGGHLHPHAGRGDVTPWVLFTVFLFGPCEPLIPLLMVPAARLSPWGVAAVAATFSVATIATMLAVVLTLRAGVGRLVPHASLARWSHAAAGATVLACAAAIHLGL